MKASISISEVPVILNPDFFTFNRWHELRRLRMILKLSDQRSPAKAAKRKILCTTCLDGKHLCHDRHCPCSCKHN